MRNLRPPSNLYLLFLKEQLISFTLLTVAMGYNDQIETEDQFVVSFSRSNNEEHNFLCELYLHNLTIMDYDVWDPNPYAGGLHLRTFMSSMRNQLRWNNVLTFVET